MSKEVDTVEYETNSKKVKDFPINVSKFVALLQHVQDEKKITKENYIDSQKELVTFSCERNDDELLIQVDKLKAKNLNLKKHLEEIEANFHTISEELISSINVQNLASMDKENEKISCKKDEIVILQQENNAAVLEFEEKEKQLQPEIQLLKEQSNKAQTEKQRALRERLALENEQLQQYVNEMKTLRNENFTLRNTLNSLRTEKQKAVDLARELNEVKRKIQELKRGKVQGGK